MPTCRGSRTVFGELIEHGVKYLPLNYRTLYMPLDYRAGDSQQRNDRWSHRRTGPASDRIRPDDKK